jgi:colicin import membrane protein
MLNFKNPKNLFFILAASIFLSQHFLSAPPAEQLLDLQEQTSTHLTESNEKIVNGIEQMITAKTAAAEARAREAEAALAEQRAESEQAIAQAKEQASQAIKIAGEQLEAANSTRKQLVAEVQAEVEEEKKTIVRLNILNQECQKALELAQKQAAEEARAIAAAEARSEEANARARDLEEEVRRQEELRAGAEARLEAAASEIQRLNAANNENLQRNISLAKENLNLATNINNRLNDMLPQTMDREGDNRAGDDRAGDDSDDDESDLDSTRSF